MSQPPPPRPRHPDPPPRDRDPLPPAPPPHHVAHPPLPPAPPCSPSAAATNEEQQQEQQRQQQHQQQQQQQQQLQQQQQQQQQQYQQQLQPQQPQQPQPQQPPQHPPQQPPHQPPPHQPPPHQPPPHQPPPHQPPAPQPQPHPHLQPPAPAQDAHQEPFRVRKRIVVLGAQAVGKSALTIQCAQNRFEPDYIFTFEDMYEWKPEVDGILYDVTIVDTEGKKLSSSSFGLQCTIGVDGYILVFSVRDRSTFELVKALNRKLLNTLDVLERDAIGTAEVPRILVGNQVDIAHEREVDAHDAQAYAASIGVPYIETSAATPFNAIEAFTALLRMIDHNVRVAHIDPSPLANSVQPPAAVLPLPTLQPTPAAPSPEATAPPDKACVVQ